MSFDPRTEPEVWIICPSSEYTWIAEQWSQALGIPITGWDCWPFIHVSNDVIHIPTALVNAKSPKVVVVKCSPEMRQVLQNIKAVILNL